MPCHMKMIKLACGVFNPLYTGNPLKGTIANNEDPDPSGSALFAMIYNLQGLK